jgi:hypothetical protein
MKYRTIHDVGTIVVDLSCLLHQTALIVKTTLVRIDACLVRMVGWKFYSSLAMLVHVWRDLSKALFLKVESTYGPEVAVSHYRRLMPKCIAGLPGYLY